MAAILQDIEDISLIGDELMLDELERRDGIYSFIFHELESTPPKLPCDVENQQLDLEEPTTLMPITEISQSYDETSPDTNADETVTAVSPTSIYSTPQVNSMLMSSAINFFNCWDPTTHQSKTTSVTTFTTYHHPPCTSYTTSLNCNFRVRISPPRFSHLSAELVRNRKHALKESADYKSFNTAATTIKPPDMRALFPHDADVHAPFLSECKDVKTENKDIEEPSTSVPKKQD